MAMKTLILHFGYELDSNRKLKINPHEADFLSI